MDFSIDVTVHSASGDSFVLGNKAIQLTVAGGRITSLFDVRLRSVSYLFSSLCVVVDELDPCSDACLSAK